MRHLKYQVIILVPNIVALYCSLFYNRWALRERCRDLRERSTKTSLARRMRGGRDPCLWLAARLSVTEQDRASLWAYFLYFSCWARAAWGCIPALNFLRQQTSVTFNKPPPRWKDAEKSRDRRALTRTVRPNAPDGAFCYRLRHVCFELWKPTCGTAPSRLTLLMQQLKWPR